MPCADAGRARSFLFLQGPLSPLYRRLGARVLAAGHRVRRVNFCVGDWLHWHGEGTELYRGSLADWPHRVAALLEEAGVTDLVLHGDTRPYHRPAVLAAEARGVRVHVTELGVLRPGFMTLERGGLNVLSRFPDDPDAIRRLAAGARDRDLSPRHPGSFALEAWQDVSYHIPNLLLSWLTPRYRRHTPQSPLVDYALWLRRLIGASARKRQAEQLQQTILTDEAPFFVLPLQVEGDYQVIAQSPFASVVDGLETIVASFVRAAPADARLVVKTHPLDNGTVDWRRAVARLAGADASAGRIVLLDGGRLPDLFTRARGVATITSTAGLEALRAGVPVKTLAPTLFDLPGLTHQGDLDGFWRAPTTPDPALVTDLLHALLATSQLRGSIHNRAGLEEAVETISARLLDPDALPGEAIVEPPPRLARARALGVPL
ncbi:capsular biosynthesis protein [Stappia sp.]|uniref:capsule biosynthesis protein n=1 Tax=Stappia sp. TaxID=1870903 RepID=UPI0032D99F2B